MVRAPLATVLGRSAWVALLVVHALGCVLVIPPIDHGAGHCQLTGDTACATCLRTSCQTPVDACCDDKSCAGEDGHATILDALDECGAGNVPSCAAGIGKGDSASAAAVRTCVTSTCRAACLGDAAVKVDWSCNVARTPDNACSACVYESCATGLDECCGDSSCKRSSDLAGDIGSCIGGDKPGCTYLLTKSDSGFEGKVRACIAKNCGAACMADRPHQSCSLQAGGSSCSCVHEEESRGPECSVGSVGGNCVLGPKGCTCGTYSCRGETAGKGCTCSFGGTAGSSTSCNVGRTSSGQGGCCLRRSDRGFSCECSEYQTSCRASAGEFSVDSCNLEDALVGLAEVLVTKCSN
jgi:hypothetical protein